MYTATVIQMSTSQSSQQPHLGNGLIVEVVPFAADGMVGIRSVMAVTQCCGKEKGLTPQNGEEARPLTSGVTHTAHKAHVLDWLGRSGERGTGKRIRELYGRVHATSRTLLKQESGSAGSRAHTVPQGEKNTGNREIFINNFLELRHNDLMRCGAPFHTPILLQWLLCIRRLNMVVSNGARSSRLLHVHLSHTC